MSKNTVSLTIEEREAVVFAIEQQQAELADVLEGKPGDSVGRIISSELNRYKGILDKLAT